MYQAAQNRYNTLPTRRCGNSGLLLPALRFRKDSG